MMSGLECCCVNWPEPTQRFAELFNLAINGNKTYILVKNGRQFNFKTVY